MRSLIGRLDACARLPKAARRAALIAALEAMSAREAGVVLDAALGCLARDGSHTALTRSILSGWARYAADAKVAVCLGLGDRFIPEVLALDTPPARSIAADCFASADLCGAIVGSDPLANADFVQLGIGWNSDRHDSARQALSRLTTIAQQEPHRLSEPVLGVLDRELVAWASRYDEHRDAGVLRVVLATTQRCGPRLNNWLIRGPLEEHLPLRAAAAKAELSVVARLAFVWLAWPALVPASRRVIERVLATDDPDLIGEMLDHWVLLRSRRRAERLRTVLSDQQFERLAARRDLTAHARRGLVSIAAGLGPRAVAALSRHGFVADRDAQVRLGLAQAVAAAGEGEEADLTLLDLGFDAESAVSMSAIGAITRARSRHRRIASMDALHSLARCQHLGVRERAVRAIERFDPLPEVKDAECRWHCPVTAVWLSKRSPDTLHDRLGVAMREVGGREAAMVLIARLDLVHQFVSALSSLASEARDGRVRARATLMLGRASDGDDSVQDLAFRTLAELLGDHDDRVRANAVEAISELRGSSIRLDRFTADPVARVRANAIRHACREIEGKPGFGEGEFGSMHLDAMLRDERAGHRLSAVWVASVVRPLELAGAIAQIAREDDDATVRARARRCAMKLLSAMQPEQREVAVA